MIILHGKHETPFTQGNTTLQNNQTIGHGNKIGIDVVCRQCSYPFVLSLQKRGIMLESVLCDCCKKELAFIIEK
jgi:hypothetical protein